MSQSVKDLCARQSQDTLAKREHRLRKHTVDGRVTLVSCRFKNQLARAKNVGARNNQPSQILPQVLNTVDGVSVSSNDNDNDNDNTH